MKRYLNMRSKEFINKVKSEIKNKKSQSLREALSKRKAKGQSLASSTQLLNEIFDDKSEAKLSSHLKLKAKELSGKDAFIPFNKAQLHFLFLLYGERFLKSKKKKVLNEMLCACISKSERMMHPQLANRRCYDNLIRETSEGKKFDARNAYESLGIVQNMNNEQNLFAPMTLASQNPNQNAARNRLQRFMPSAAQESILKDDNRNHAGKVPKSILEQRAKEFSVAESQIRRWHSAFQKKNS